ncbi:MAG TPA: NAD(P)/FAD-dependent oxidoreductase [Candidatus Limnocylindrales bacterium]|nr:NAD(P)/FAD-dependent oxidoreductase [Candidatus Limnocylindrales bacterium]
MQQRPSAAQAGQRHRVVIVGGGFGGLNAAQRLAGDARIDVTLVDRHNYHLFQPLLYQVATGALAPGEIAQPLRSILRRHRNVTVLLGEAVAIDPARREIELSDGGPIPYDTLVVATGAHHSYFGHDAWARFAPGLKSIDDATEMRRRILIAFEAAEREHNPERRREWMTFVVVGGGPTGVELAGSLGEIAHDTLRRDFRKIVPAEANILLVEGLPRVLPPYPEDRSRSAKRQLEHLGVVVRTGALVTDIDDHGVTVTTGSGTDHESSERVPARTVLWAAGVQASSFVRKVAAATGAEADRSGRLKVGPDLTVPGHPEIFVIGDAAIQPGGPKGGPVPGVAQGAIQPGRYAAASIQTRLDGRAAEIKPFHYVNRGDVAVIGRLAGVTNIPWLGPFGRQSGFAAWALWLGIHIVYLIGFANRMVVLVRWAWSFLTHGRNSRLITGQPFVPEIEDPEPPA